MRENSIKNIKYYLTVLIAIGIYVFLFRKVDIQTIFKQILDADKSLILLALFLSGMRNAVISPMRWKEILFSLGYKIHFKDFDATASAMKDGWFATGDLGSLRNGTLTVTGRKDNMFISLFLSIFTSL